MKENKLKIYCDGGARGNPGPAAAGVIIKSTKKIVKFKKYLGERTNNQAEYEAILLALEKIEKEFPQAKNLEFFLDSELVAKQLRGEYKIKNESLGKKLISIKNHVLIRGIKVAYKHIPREENKEADKLVNEAIDKAFGK